MTARETLAEAHKAMTPEQIAAHALVLATFLEAQAGLVETLIAFLRAQGNRIRVTEDHEAILVAGIRQAIELAESGRARRAADLLANLLPRASEGSKRAAQTWSVCAV